VKTMKILGLILDPVKVKNGIPKLRLPFPSLNYPLLIVKSMYVMMFHRIKSPLEGDHGSKKEKKKN